MKRLFNPVLAILGLLLFVAGLHQDRSHLHGCATVSPKQGANVGIATESAIILWDPQEKIEHFIRRASFTTQAKDFGFLVPTPTQPKVTEADDAIFDRLEKLTEPKRKTETRTEWNWLPPIVGSGADDAPTKNSPSAGYVRTLDQGRVGNLAFIVLEAKDPNRLSQWLKDHGYVSRPALTSWLTPYVKQNWKITAFKIAKGETNDDSVATSAVRMTFPARQPFFPYREPEDQKESRSQARLLRIFFLSSHRMEGRLGDKESWPGKVEHAGPLAASDRESILAKLTMPPGTKPDAWWVTVMDDRSDKRPGDKDVYFFQSSDQSKVSRPPIVEIKKIEIPAGIICCFGVLVLPFAGLGLFLMLRSRKRTQS